MTPQESLAEIEREIREASERIQQSVAERMWDDVELDADRLCRLAGTASRMDHDYQALGLLDDVAHEDDET